MDFPSAPKGILYDNRGIRYFEIYKDGTVNQISSDRYSIDHKEENSLYHAYYRALHNVCVLYFACADSNGNISIYRADDLEALADSVGISHPSDHVHNVRWSYSKDDAGKGRYAWLDIEFLCGCELSSLNKRTIARQFKEQFGWEVILGSINSIPSSRKTIQVERKSIRS